MIKKFLMPENHYCSTLQLSTHIKQAYSTAVIFYFLKKNIYVIDHLGAAKQSGQNLHIFTFKQTVAFSDKKHV